MTGNVVKIPRAKAAKAKEVVERVWICVSRDEQGIYHAPTIHQTEAEAEKVAQTLLTRRLRVFVGQFQVPG